jgi:hypothetical protein
MKYITQEDPMTWAFFPDQYDWVDITSEAINLHDEIAIIYTIDYLIVYKFYFDSEVSWMMHSNEHERRRSRKGLYCLETDKGTFYIDADDSVRRRKPHARAEKGV